jgi:hypothetical protein
MKKVYPRCIYRLINLIILFVIILASCLKQSKKEIKSEIFVFQNKSESINSSQIVVKVGFIPLETSKDNLIGNISKIVKYDEKYFVLDAKSAKKIFVFDQLGKFLYSIGKIGKGPGEYSRLMDFCIDTLYNNIYIIDWGQKIIKTDLHGNLILEKKAPKDCQYFTNILSMDGFVYTYTGHQAGNIKKFQIVQFDKNLLPIKWFLPYKLSFPGTRSFNNVLYNYKGNMFFVSVFDNAIYQKSGDSFKRRYSFNFGGKELSLEKLTAEQFVNNKTSAFLYNSCVEGDEIINLPIFDEGRPKYGFLNKKMNRFFLYNKINQDSIFLIPPISFSKGKFISTCNSNVFNMTFPFSDLRPKNTDNPIIVEYQISFIDEK